jgi:Transposase DDE domain group 1
MTSPKTECSAKTYQFGQLDRRQVVADFSGGTLTQDGGVILVSAIDQHLRLSERLAACFTDQRETSRVQHALKDMLAQRLYGLVQGYEDLNDHDVIRHDPMFGVAIGKLESGHGRCAPLAGKSTLNRLEQAMSVPFDLSQERYHKFNLAPRQIESLFVDLFVEQHSPVPAQIILDMDVTNDSVHGEQVGAFFNGYYDEICYAPLLIFCGRHLLSAKLRSSNVDPAAGALPELQRLIPQIRHHWPQVKIVVRGDSAYSRDDIMTWCEGQTDVEYVLAHASNVRLRELTWHLEARAQAAYEQSRAAVAEALKTSLGDHPDTLTDLDALVPAQVYYQSLNYCTQHSWSCTRRLVCKLTYDAQGARRHFVVCSWTADQISPARVHVDYYCPRGEMENRIKEHQLDLFSDRTSTHEFESNQLRLWFSSFAYVLLQGLRQQALANTDLADACCGTIRRQLLKVAAQIRCSARRIVIALSSNWKGQDWFDQAYHRLASLSPSG